LKNQMRQSAGFVMLAVVITGGVLVDFAWAGDGALFTRHNYDLLMRWINFIILAVVIVKYGRKPLLQFLDNQKKVVTRSISKLEEKKKEAEALMVKSQNELDDSKERLARIKEKIIAEGQNRKEQLIAEAQNDARNMMASAKSKIEGQMRSAYTDIKAELVDMAADMATEKLPTIITAEDQQQWTLRWFESTQSEEMAAK